MEKVDVPEALKLERQFDDGAERHGRPNASVEAPTPNRLQGAGSVVKGGASPKAARQNGSLLIKGVPGV